MPRAYTKDPAATPGRPPAAKPLIYPVRVRITAELETQLRRLLQVVWSDGRPITRSRLIRAALRRGFEQLAREHSEHARTRLARQANAAGGKKTS